MQLRETWFSQGGICPCEPSSRGSASRPSLLPSPSAYPPCPAPSSPQLDSNALTAIYHVKLTDVIKIKVLENTLLGAVAGTECLGRLDIPVSDVVTAKSRWEKGLALREGGKGEEAEGR